MKIITKIKQKEKGWHFIGNRMKLHFIIGKQEDNIGWVTLCKQQANGMSVEQFQPKDYPERAVCKTCMRLKN